MKQAKASVDYGKGMKSAHCSICTHYQRGKQGLHGSCELVAGSIDPEFWCKLFKKG
jgi:hypothetical protein